VLLQRRQQLVRAEAGLAALLRRHARLLRPAPGWLQQRRVRHDRGQEHLRLQLRLKLL
jgi:hypothetical protein